MAPSTPMNPVQLFRTWRKKDRKTAINSSIESGRINKSPSLRSLLIRHLPSDSDNWIDGVSDIRLERRFEQNYSVVSSLPLDVKSVPPRRPPRPPSLYSHPLSQPSDNTENSDDNLTVGPQRKLPELDGIWEDFLKDANEDPAYLQFEVSTSQGKLLRRDTLLDGQDGHGLLRRPDHRPTPSGIHDPLEGDDLRQALALLFPLPPSLSTDSVSQSTILYSSPSPGTSSYDSTPIATPTSPSSPMQSSMSSYFHGSCLSPAFQFSGPPSHHSFSSLSLDRTNSSGSAKSSLSSNSEPDNPVMDQNDLQVNWGYAV